MLQHIPHLSFFLGGHFHMSLLSSHLLKPPSYVGYTNTTSTHTK